MLGLVLKQAKPYLPYIAVILVMIAFVLYNRWVAYNNGVDDTVEKYEIVIEEERQRIEEINATTLEEARRKIEDLREKIGERDETVRELREQARQDPNADRPSISIDGVRRLNRIR